MLRAAIVSAFALLLGGCGAPGVAYRAPAQAGDAAAARAASVALPAGMQRVCPPAFPAAARCLAIVRDDGSNVPKGYGPADLQSAYALPASQGAGQTIAVIEAYDDPHGGSDLRFYRATYGLPACTHAKNCFRKVNQAGNPGPYPVPSKAWALEESLDVDMVSAACPNCNILVVEANNDAQTNLGEAVATAARLGANAISNSYVSYNTLDASYYDQPGVVITAAAGDAGYGAGVPAGLPTVVAVGGTTLTRTSGGRGWAETAWKGTGSGCEPALQKPAWQRDAGCPGRTMNDVAAVGDPQTPVAIYDTYGYSGFVEGAGTSASAPLVAAIYGLAGNASSLVAAQSLYPPSAALNDVTSGSNGTCRPAYLCNARKGYDGPSGNGTPNGVGAF